MLCCHHVQRWCGDGMDTSKIKALQIFKKAALPKGRPSKPATGARFVFFVGDEGVVLISLKGNVVQSRQFVPDLNPENLGALRQIFATNKKAPIMLVADVMDQAYVQQTLPPVNGMSTQRLIKRRLARDFANSPIKGALLLGREKTGRRDWNFMMIAVEKGPQISACLDFIEDLPNRFQGIYLVSVEAEHIVQQLEQAVVTDPQKRGSQWQFLVSHNKVGGFRQVILRNGKVVFTRMSQPIGDTTPEVMAGNIEQEISSTIEYMRRLSFNAADGLDIYVIAASAIRAAIDKAKFPARNIALLTPYEASEHLGLAGATQVSDQFGDVVLAAAIGASRKHHLRLFTPETEKLNRIYQAMLMQRAAATAICVGMVLYMFSLLFSIYEGYSAENELTHKKAVQNGNLDLLHSDIKKSGIDVEQTSDIIDLYQQLQKEPLSVLPFISAIRPVIKPPVVVKRFDWTLDQSKDGGGTPKTIAVMTLEFKGVTVIEKFRPAAKELKVGLEKVLPGYTVEYTGLPAVFSDADKLDIQLDKQAIAAAANNNALDVQLTIKGPVFKEKTAASPQENSEKKEP